MNVTYERRFIIISSLYLSVINSTKNTAEATDNETSESVLVTGQKTEVVRPENIKKNALTGRFRTISRQKWRITIEIGTLRMLKDNKSPVNGHLRPSVSYANEKFTYLQLGKWKNIIASKVRFLIDQGNFRRYESRLKRRGRSPVFMATHVNGHVRQSIIWHYGRHKNLSFPPIVVLMTRSAGRLLATFNLIPVRHFAS